jgi:hypothetical protein
VWCADSEITDWVEANSSIVVTESPLSLLRSSFSENTPGEGKAIIESWYGALVLLEDIDFSGSTATLLLNDDPPVDPQNEVFFADPAAAYMVNTSGAGMRSPRPLSESPEVFLTLEDEKFVTMFEVRRFRFMNHACAPL